MVLRPSTDSFSVHPKHHLASKVSCDRQMCLINFLEKLTDPQLVKILVYMFNRSGSFISVFPNARY